MHNSASNGEGFFLPAVIFTASRSWSQALL